MGIRLSAQGGQVRAAWSWYDGPKEKASRNLTAAEANTLKRLLRSADVYADRSPGQDLRGLDFPYVTLQVKDAGRVVRVVLFKNRVYESGVRGELAQFLSTLYRALQDAGRKK